MFCRYICIGRRESKRELEKDRERERGKEGGREGRNTITTTTIIYLYDYLLSIILLHSI